MLKLLTLALSATGAFAALRAGTPALLGRDVVELPCSSQGQKDCGKGCIDLAWTCCPDGAGGCGPTDYCNLGNNNQYNCCPRGSVCDGPGGATTHDGKTITSTIVNTQTVVSSSTRTLTSTVSSQQPPVSKSTTTVVPPPQTSSAKPTTTSPARVSQTTPATPAKTTTSVVVVTAGAAHVVPGIVGVVAGAAALLI